MTTATAPRFLSEGEYRRRFGWLALTYAERLRGLIRDYPDCESRSICCELSPDWLSTADLRDRLAILTTFEEREG